MQVTLGKQHVPWEIKKFYILHTVFVSFLRSVRSGDIRLPWLNECESVKEIVKRFTEYLSPLEDAFQRVIQQCREGKIFMKGKKMGLSKNGKQLGPRIHPENLEKFQDQIFVMTRMFERRYGRSLFVISDADWWNSQIDCRIRVQADPLFVAWVFREFIPQIRVLTCDDETGEFYEVPIRDAVAMFARNYDLENSDYRTPLRLSPWKKSGYRKKTFDTNVERVLRDDERLSTVKSLKAIQPEVYLWRECAKREINSDGYKRSWKSVRYIGPEGKRTKVTCYRRNIPIRKKEIAYPWKSPHLKRYLLGTGKKMLESASLFILGCGIGFDVLNCLLGVGCP